MGLLPWVGGPRGRGGGAVRSPGRRGLGQVRAVPKLGGWESGEGGLSASKTGLWGRDHGRGLSETIFVALGMAAAAARPRARLEPVWCGGASWWGETWETARTGARSAPAARGRRHRAWGAP